MKLKNYSLLTCLTLLVTQSFLAQNTFRISSNTFVVGNGNVTINYNGATLTNNGTIINNGGSLIFSAPVTFEGTGTAATQNLKIQHTGTSLLNNRINVAGSVEVSNGSLNANNNLTLLSNATSSAVIAPVAVGSSITGKVTVQRFIPQGKRAFRFLTPSVTTDDFIRNNWQLATHITGSSTGANGFDATGTGNPSLFTYNNQQATGTGWTPIATTNATNLEATKGYRLLIRGDRDININAASLANMNNPITLTATGTVATGTIFLTTSSNPAMNNTNNPTTNGYSLIGNPYVNTVNWNTLTKSGLTDAYYSWDANMGTVSQRGRYVVYSSVTGSNNMASSVSQYIQPGQAFFVKNTTLGVAGSITFHETDKQGTNVNPTFFRTTENDLARLDLQVFETNEMALNTNPIDAAVAVFGSEFSNQLETGDVEKLSTGIENLSFFNSTTSLAIDARPAVVATDELAIQLQEFQPNKSYTFRPQFSNFDPTTTPFLLDTYLNQYTALALDTPTNVTFNTTTDAASFATNRFKIVFQNSALNNPTFNAAHVVLYPNPVANNQFNIALPSYFSGKVNIAIVNTIGQVVYVTNQDAQNTLSINPTSVLAQGMYLVQITNQGTTITKKITIQ
jgi:Secretion system C-terminal sorting domain